MKNKEKLLITVALSGFSVVISYLINFLVTPYITEKIGMDAYGFVSVANNVVGYAGILTVALTAFTVRFVSVAYHQGNILESNRYYSSSICACVCLTGAMFILSLPIIIQLEKFLIIPDSLVTSVKNLFLLVFANFVVNTVLVPFSVAAYIKNRLDYYNLIRIAAHIIQALVLIAMFKQFNASVWFVGVGVVASSLFTLVCNYLMTRKLTPDLKFRIRNSSFLLVRNILKNGIWSSINQLGNTLNGGLDLIISNLMLTGTAMGQIAVAKTIGTIFNTLYSVVFQPFQPQLIKTYVEGNKKKFVKKLIQTMKFCGFFSNLAFAGFAALGLLYYKLWLPSEDSSLLYILTVLTVLGSVTGGVIQPVYYVNTLTLKNKLPCWITIAGGVANLMAMYFLLSYTEMGVYAVVITTSVVMICINLFFNPIYSARCLAVSPRPFYYAIIRHILSTVIMTGVFWRIVKIINPTGWISLICTALVLCVIGLVIHTIVVCDREDWGYVTKMIGKSRKNELEK